MTLVVFYFHFILSFILALFFGIFIGKILNTNDANNNELKIDRILIDTIYF